MGTPIQGWAVPFTGAELVKMACARLNTIDRLQSEKAVWFTPASGIAAYFTQCEAERRLLELLISRTDEKATYLLSPADLRVLSLPVEALDADS
jgi:hypothetical protein